MEIESLEVEKRMNAGWFWSEKTDDQDLKNSWLKLDEFVQNLANFQLLVSDLKILCLKEVSMQFNIVEVRHNYTFQIFMIRFQSNLAINVVW